MLVAAVRCSVQVNDVAVIAGTAETATSCGLNTDCKVRTAAVAVVVMCTTVILPYVIILIVAISANNSRRRLRPAIHSIYLLGRHIIVGRFSVLLVVSCFSFFIFDTHALISQTAKKRPVWYEDL